ncbi:MAG: ATP-binding protein, partial [Kofleriaceae bacterium]
MTPLGPVPFVGRQQELAELKQHLAVVSLVSLHGPLGVGKSRLVQELAPSLGAPCTVIECHLGDRASALRSRAERALRCVPGSLAQTLTHTARVLIIDDIQHLRVDEATNLLAPLALGQTALGRVVVVGRDPLAAAVGAAIAEVELAGLDIDSASALWTNLEETFGEADGWDNAFSRTRGVPLALRREYARARFGANAWDLTALDRGARSALEALAILRQAVAPAAVSALTGEDDTEAALTGLVARQLVDAVGDGRVVVHEVVRVDVLAQIDPERKQQLSRAAAELVASTSAVAAGPRLAWQAGDDGAFGAMDLITRVREVVWHWIAAGEFGRAADVLLDHRELAARSGGAGEFEALLDALGDHRPRQRRGDVTTTGQVSTLTSFLDPDHARALSQLRIEIAVRGGRYTEAFERASAAPGAVSPLLHAELVASTSAVSAGPRLAWQ